MEMAGGSISKICVNDEVKYIEKVWKSKPHLLSNDPMIVVRTNPSNFTDEPRRTVTLYNKLESKFFEVPHGYLEVVPLQE